MTSLEATRRNLQRMMRPFHRIKTRFGPIVNPLPECLVLFEQLRRQLVAESSEKLFALLDLFVPVGGIHSQKFVHDIL